MSNNGTERRKETQEQKASGESGNYAEVQLIVPNPLPLTSDQIIIAPGITLTSHGAAVPRTEFKKGQVLFFVPLHIPSMHIASKWVQISSQNHVPAMGSNNHTWGCTVMVTGEGLSNGGGRQGSQLSCFH